MRTLCGLLLIVALGCGGNSTPPTPEPKAPTPADAPPAGTPTPQPKPDEPKKEDPKTPVVPSVPAAVWEPDPAKHVVPAAPPSGSLGKAAFAPQQVEFQTDTLTFRTIDKDGNALKTMSVKLLEEQAKTAAGGVKLVVKPDDPMGKVPTVGVELPPVKAGDLPKLYEYPHGYGLTLELGKREKGSVAGRVYLSLPGEEKDFLAGTFTADFVRSPSEPPGADDTPFVQGAVTVAGAKADTKVAVGYVGLVKEAPPVDSLVMPFAGAGGLFGRSDNAKPRATVYVTAEAADKAGRYEHVRLPAGKYLVFAASDGFAPQAKWLTLPADGKLAHDFALNPAAAGKLAVKAPAGTTGKAQAVPADDSPLPPEVFATAASALGLDADVRDGVARFERLAPGRYEVRLGELSGTVEVKVNETATLELAPPKK
ncbi:carboxypeptidase-like regulatory domain-containing protein [Urbifossiella limnaea]|uniref:Uncharacterized protein n=1 Tax=Urbifossiella limnaea TaxID=2528023 RepID=A0A517XRH7_9BACT|nr:carboxypeptidase-like regulatory domain-containing protein [Urbifossiella limnaea]QDU20114.1 hypothetical protein ETAA1_20570 [Urbifossiella limnaea]